MLCESGQFLIPAWFRQKILEIPKLKYLLKSPCVKSSPRSTSTQEMLCCLPFDWGDQTLLSWALWVGTVHAGAPRRTSQLGISDCLFKQRKKAGTLHLSHSLTAPHEWEKLTSPVSPSLSHYTMLMTLCVVGFPCQANLWPQVGSYDLTQCWPLPGDSVRPHEGKAQSPDTDPHFRCQLQGVGPQPTQHVCVTWPQIEGSLPFMASCPLDRIIC